MKTFIALIAISLSLSLFSQNGYIEFSEPDTKLLEEFEKLDFTKKFYKKAINDTTSSTVTFLISNNESLLETYTKSKDFNVLPCNFNKTDFVLVLQLKNDILKSEKTKIDLVKDEQYEVDLYVVFKKNKSQARQAKIKLTTGMVHVKDFNEDEIKLRCKITSHEFFHICCLIDFPIEKEHFYGMR